MASSGETTTVTSSLVNQRSIQKKKTLYLIRHAESEENRRLASLQKVVASLLQFSLPSSNDMYAALGLIDVVGQIDSPVSSKGQQQIKNVREQMMTTNFWHDEAKAQAILHSPLQRAKDTCLGLLHDGSNPLTVVPMEESMLLLEKTPTEWVFPKSFVARLQAFQDHILHRPEERFVVVGHSQFFKALLQVNFKFNNCDVWKVELCGNSCDPETQETLSPQWSNLQPLLACQELTENDDNDPAKEG